MSVLVTGAGGFLGTAVVRRLLAHGQRPVRCLVRRTDAARRLEALGEEASGGSVECVVGDMRSRPALEAALEGVDCVYHLAAVMKGSFPEMVMGTVVGTRDLLEAMDARAPRARLVLVSSFAVYGTAGLPAGALVDETAPLEPLAAQRGGYAWSKLRQERLVFEHAQQSGRDVVVLRPGVVYGPGGPVFSPRVGVQLPGLFLHLGRRNLIPLTYVDNCAEAVVVAGRNAASAGAVYNVVDDDLVTSAEYLRAYRANVKRIRFLTLPYPLMRVLAGAVEWYHRHSKGQLPAFFTRYKTDTNWKGCTFTNARLRSIGWAPIVSTAEGMRRTFEALREESDAA